MLYALSKIANNMRSKSITFLFFFITLWSIPSYACHQDFLIGERCGRTVSVSDNTIYLTYQTFLSDASYIAFEKSNDLGTTWSSPIVLSSVPGGIRPAITADKFGGVYVAWYIEDAGTVFWSYSQDAGLTWTKESIVVSEQEIHNPEIVVKRSSVDDITVKIASVSDADRHVLFHLTTDLGENWSSTIDLGALEVGRAALIQDRVKPDSHLAFISESLRQVVYANERDNFQSITVVSDNPNQDPIPFMTMASPGIRIFYITWPQKVSNAPVLRLATSKDGGDTWEQLPDILRTGDNYTRPHMLIRKADTSTQVFLATGRATDLGVLFLRSLDGGVTWSEPISLCPSGFACAWPRLSYGAENELILTMGSRVRAGPGNPIQPQHMFSITSIDNGVSWSESKRMTGSCDGVPATILGTEGDDVINGTSGSDVIIGLGGNDLIFGKVGDDMICGGDGDDTCNGGIGNDTASTCEITQNIP